MSEEKKKIQKLKKKIEKKEIPHNFKEWNEEEQEAYTYHEDEHILPLSKKIPKKKKKSKSK